jgi:hypothetical protein
LNDEPIDLPAIEQQLAPSKGIVIPGSAGLVFRNVKVYQPRLSGANLGVGLAQRSFPFTKSLDFGAYEDQASFKLIQQLVIVGRGPILGDDLIALLIPLLCGIHGAVMIAVAHKDPQVTAAVDVP